MSLNTTPRTWVAGAVVTAAQMNTEVRDALTGIQAAWSTFTPSVSGITTGNGTTTATYTRFGKTVLFRYQFTFGSTSSVTGSTSINLPVTAKIDSWAATSIAFDTSAGSWYPLIAPANSTTTMRIMQPAAAGSAATNLGPSSPFAWGTGDLITVSGSYEAA